ncbi:MAG: sugar ABC transporter permease, partial [Oscillospiraceae bacterium]|nr:sugar ABC transporter permease [Oscillospiraceae bacterium]
MKQIKKVLGENLSKYTMILALVALVIFFNIASGGKMVTPSNFQNLLSGNAYVLILAIGMLMVIVIGHIDLSVGSVAGFCGMVMAIAFQTWNLPWWAAVLLALGVGALVGAWNGFWVAKMGIPGFITTLGSQMVFRGAVIWISRSISVPAPTELKWFGAGHLPEWGPAFTGMNNSTLLLGIFAIAFFAYSQIRQYKRTNVLRGSKEALWPTLVRIALISATIGYLTWLFGTGRPG